MGVKRYIFKLDLQATQILQMAVTRMLKGKAWIEAPSRPLEYDIGMVPKRLEEGPEKEVKTLKERIKKMWTLEEVNVTVRHAVQPYKYFMKTMKIVFVILLVEIGLVFLFFLLEYLL